MSYTAEALLGLVLWSIFLAVALGVVRLLEISKGKAPNSFYPLGKDVGPLAYRVTRAHANSLAALTQGIGS